MAVRFTRERHTLELSVEARALERQRKEATAQLVAPPAAAFRIECDEGAYLGGDDTAPPPLAYLSAAVAF